MDVEQIFDQLSQDKKMERRKGLVSLKKLVENGIENAEKVFVQLETILMSKLSDQSELNRQLACEILVLFLKSSVFTEKSLCACVTVIHYRIGKYPKEEDSEDIQCALMTLLKALVNHFTEELLIAHLNDIIDIIRLSLAERSKEILLETVSCICDLASKMKKTFHLQSEVLLKPLSAALQKERFKIRVKCLQAIGCVLVHGNNDALPGVVEALGLCVKDIPQVKLALLDLGTALAMEMKERYSYWAMILPLVLFGLRDENPEVQAKAIQSWTSIGAQYESENEERLRDQINFYQKRKHFPAGEIDFGVGCQALVQACLDPLVKSIKKSVSNWQDFTRLHSVKLLGSLILGGQDNIIQYAEGIIECAFFAGEDTDPNIVKEGLICANYLAYFVPARVYMPFLEAEYKDSSPNFNLLLQSVLEGTPTHQRQDALEGFMTLLNKQNLLESADIESALSCVRLMVESCALETHLLPLTKHLILLQSRQLSASKILDELAVKNQFDSAETLIGSLTETLLQEIKQAAVIGMENTPDMILFECILKQNGVEEHLSVILDILRVAMNPKESPLLCFKCLESVRQIFMTSSSVQCGSQMETFIVAFLEDPLNKLLPWGAGKTAEAMRTAAVSCLLAVVNYSKGNYTILKALKVSMTLLPALLTDDSSTTRQVVCFLIRSLCKSFPNNFKQDLLLSFISILIERLEDKILAVRIAAVQSIPVVLESHPGSWKDKQSIIEQQIESLVIYLDEDDIEIRQNVLDTLKLMAAVSPAFTASALSREGKIFRRQSQLDQLRTHLTTLML